MNSYEMLSKQIDYHLWATGRLLEDSGQLTPAALLEDRGASFRSILATLRHMYAADVLWVDRLKGSSQLVLSGIGSPEAIDYLSEAWLAILTGLRHYVNDLNENHIGTLRTFHNSQGVKFEMPVWQIILHTVNHGTGHRGQVHGLLRQAGFVPQNTDLVQYYRTAAAKK